MAYPLSPTPHERAVQQHPCLSAQQRPCLSACCLVRPGARQARRTPACSRPAALQGRHGQVMHWERAAQGAVRGPGAHLAAKRQLQHAAAHARGLRVIVRHPNQGGSAAPQHLPTTTVITLTGARKLR